MDATRVWVVYDIFCEQVVAVFSTEERAREFRGDITPQFSIEGFQVDDSGTTVDGYFGA
jgi:hypothetical protein